MTTTLALRALHLPSAYERNYDPITIPRNGPRRKFAPCSGLLERDRGIL